MSSHMASTNLPRSHGTCWDSIVATALAGELENHNAIQTNTIDRHAFPQLVKKRLSLSLCLSLSLWCYSVSFRTILGGAGGKLRTLAELPWSSSTPPLSYLPAKLQTPEVFSVQSRELLDPIKLFITVHSSFGIAMKVAVCASVINAIRMILYIRIQNHSQINTTTDYHVCTVAVSVYQKRNQRIRCLDKFV